MPWTVPKLNKDEYSVSQWYASTTLHRHVDWEFTTLTKGNAVNHINNAAYPANYGSFLLLGPQHIHIQTTEEAITRLDLCISAECFERYCEELKPGLYGELCSITEPIVITPSLAVYQDLIQRLLMVENLRTLNNESGKHIAHSIIAFLIGIYIEDVEVKSNSTTPEWFYEFIRKLGDPAVFSKRIEEIISETGYSHSQFLILFKKYSGKTLIDYLTNIRMLHAEKMLVYTKAPVIEIANNVGYGNPSFFSQKFKKYFKVSPMEYRKNKFKQQ